MNWRNQNLIDILKENGVVVMPTDTIYGIVGQALNSSVVNRIYDIRKRAGDKPCIILIEDVNELEKFSIYLSLEQKKAIKKYWPGDLRQEHIFSQIPATQHQHSKKYVSVPRPASIVFDCTSKELEYLHRGTKTLAFRLPQDKNLQKLLKETGPLIAPSANIEGLPPAQNIKDAQKYFGDTVDLYIDGGMLVGKASKVIKLHKDGSMDILRE